jgi:hypothetical protein
MLLAKGESDFIAKLAAEAPALTDKPALEVCAEPSLIVPTTLSDGRRRGFIGGCNKLVL